MSELVVDSMSEREARQLVTEINGHLHSARYKLYQLWNRQGWLALGYDSWESCLRGEFSSHRSYLYRQLAAARLEDAANLNIDTLKESWVREVNSILDNEEYRVEAVLLALSQGANETSDFTHAAKQVYIAKSGVVNPLHYWWSRGEISTNDAYDIMVMINTTDLEPDGIQALARCKDSQLAQMLVGLAKDRHPIWGEILATGAIPTLDSHVAIGDARARDLLNYLTIDETERRAAQLGDGQRWAKYMEAVGMLENAAKLVLRFGYNEDTKTQLIVALKQLRRVQDGNPGGAEANRASYGQDADTP